MKRSFYFSFVSDGFRLFIFSIVRRVIVVGFWDRGGLLEEVETLVCTLVCLVFLLCFFCPGHFMCTSPDEPRLQRIFSRTRPPESVAATYGREVLLGAQRCVDTVF